MDEKTNIKDFKTIPLDQLFNYSKADKQRMLDSRKKSAGRSCYEWAWSVVNANKSK